MNNQENNQGKTQQNQQKSNIFLVAGRTGGPLMPVLAISKNLANVQPIIIGILGGFEDKVAKENQILLEHLPEAKFTIFSFTNNDWYDWIKEFFLTIWNGFLLIFSVFKSIFLLIKYKPKLIITAGGFVAVPLAWACVFTNFLRQTSTLIVMHQQDPQPGLSNKIVSKMANLKTCVFDYTRQKYPSFADCQIIPNPIDSQQYEPDFQKKLWKDLAKDEPKLFSFLNKIDDQKPLMLVFGGGGGAWAINRWVVEQSDQILQNFYVIHLTGTLQPEDDFDEILDAGYIRLVGLWKHMALVMNMCDLVVCRAGMGSIGELEFLNKPGFLIPLPHSHQEVNAKLVEDKFVVMPQEIIKKRPGKEKWLDIILQNYPENFLKSKLENPEEVKQKLKEYYKKIENLL